MVEEVFRSFTQVKILIPHFTKISPVLKISLKYKYVSVIRNHNNNNNNTSVYYNCACVCMRVYLSYHLVIIVLMHKCNSRITGLYDGEL